MRPASTGTLLRRRRACPAAEADDRQREHRVQADRRDLRQTPLETLKEWEAFHTADQASPYLHKAMVDSRFDYIEDDQRREREAAAVEARASPWSTARSASWSARTMSRHYFPPASKAKMDELVGNLKIAMAAASRATTGWARRPRRRRWRSSSKMDVMVGYPDKWRDYARAPDRAPTTSTATSSAPARFDCAYDRRSRQAGRPQGVGHEPADGERLQRRRRERDRVPGRHPAAAVLRSERRRRRSITARSAR